MILIKLYKSIILKIRSITEKTSVKESIKRKAKTSSQSSKLSSSLKSWPKKKQKIALKERTYYFCVFICKNAMKPRHECKYVLYNK